MNNGMFTTVNSWSVNHRNGTSSFCRKVDNNPARCVTHFSGARQGPVIRSHANVTARELHGRTLVDQPMRVRNGGTRRPDPPKIPVVTVQQLEATRRHDLEIMTRNFQPNVTAAEKLRDEAQQQCQQEHDEYYAAGNAKSLDIAKQNIIKAHEQLENGQRQKYEADNLIKESDRRIEHLINERIAIEEERQLHPGTEIQERWFRKEHEINMAKFERAIHQQTADIRSDHINKTTHRKSEMADHLNNLAIHLATLNGEKAQRLAQEAQQKGFVGKAQPAEQQRQALDVPPLSPTAVDPTAPAIAMVPNPRALAGAMGKLAVDSCAKNPVCREKIAGSALGTALGIEITHKPAGSLSPAQYDRVFLTALSGDPAKRDRLSPQERIAFDDLLCNSQKDLIDLLCHAGKIPPAADLPTLCSSSPAQRYLLRRVGAGNRLQTIPATLQASPIRVCPRR
ncbi:hypothetical protein [Acerihabitans sp.]|uniref:hypothetical protein n=1 Tax=Acerihabitans sp. TaxID=2811394 RepID=UPI002EDB9E43